MKLHNPGPWTGWLTEYRCIYCDVNTTYDVRMSSHGRCPKCGHKGPDACTIMETTEAPVRYRKLLPWWCFWRSQQYERQYLSDCVSRETSR